VGKTCFVSFLLFAILLQTTKGCECNCSEYKGTIDLDFNPAFLSVAEFDGDPAGLSLYVTSFFNAAYKERIFPINLFLGLAIISFERDLVARIPGIDQVVQADAYESAEVEELTDLNPFSFLCFGPYYKTEWPNDAIKVPEGVFPFQALLIPQGFLVDPQPGRLSVINMDDPNRREFVIDETKKFFFPRYYHEVVFYDMNGDGLLDIVAARSPFHPQVSMALRSISLNIGWFTV